MKQKIQECWIVTQRKFECMKKLCTVIVPLKDNHHRTTNLLRYSIFDDFEYIFADGSLGDENQEIFDSINKSNIRYFRFDYDSSIEKFYKKMYPIS